MGNVIGGESRGKGSGKVKGRRSKSKANKKGGT